MVGRIFVKMKRRDFCEGEKSFVCGGVYGGIAGVGGGYSFR